MGDVLIDDRDALIVDCDDEGVAELPERNERTDFWLGASGLPVWNRQRFAHGTGERGPRR